MSAYIDTSALAKCYIREPRSLEVLDWADAQDGVVTSPLTLVEFRCLLARRRRAGQIDLLLERVVLAEFERDVHARTWRIYQDTAGLFDEARQLIDLVPEVPLRALDALHLAYARHYDAKVFATADKNQAEAARALGLPLTIFY
ncbi:type II toxin-antitoxin system VapC family toxin [Thiobacillus denitrificans]|uniref:type II toxin-antitoxin system VapC family toxin n=1 Tax=Thiobacillus denitrificans TaxID=36861 RepID=UPI000360CE68|nr:type II toxin-antitoxin system VapC family toxin [Thiobacillus denitrificans]